MSEQALVDTIELELRQARAASARLFLAPGNYGLDYLAQRGWAGWGIPTVKCSNFLGEALDIALSLGFQQVVLVGHAGKLVKLAGGVFQTHSRYADCRSELFCAHAALCGADAQTCRALMDAATVDACLACLDEAGLRPAVLASPAARHPAPAGPPRRGRPVRGLDSLFECLWGTRANRDRKGGYTGMGNGILYGVSVGPGDPELLTLKAARVLARCAVVAAPQTPAGGMLALDIARQAVDLSAKRILPLRFAMSRDAQTREAAHRAADTGPARGAGRGRRRGPAQPRGRHGVLLLRAHPGGPCCRGAIAWR